MKEELRNQRVIECFKKSKHALSQAEIIELTGMSRAAVSCALEFLKGAGVIKLYRVVGNNVLYHLEENKQVMENAGD